MIDSLKQGRICAIGRDEMDVVHVTKSGEDDVGVATSHNVHDCDDSEVTKKPNDVAEQDLKFCPPMSCLVPSVEPSSYVEVVRQDFVCKKPLFCMWLGL